MNTKLLIFLTWAFYFVLLQTSDGFWRFCLVYSTVLAICSFFYRQDNKPKKSKKK